MSRGQTLHAGDLPVEVGRYRSDTPERSALTPGTTELVVHPSGQSPASELERIRKALDAHQWRRAEAANALGMSRTTLWRKMRQYGL